ncbi:MAG: DUF4623 domain-containing protein [Rhodothermus sp.]|nr:DUF4623 domain-containing protein [Rhodothermus sp.]
MRTIATITTAIISLWILCQVNLAWAQKTDYVFDVPVSSNFQDPYTVGFHSGARGVYGPCDMDGDGKVEVLVTDYSGGGRVYVIENRGVDTWELVYATPWVDSTSTSYNARYAICGDLDGDGNGELIFLSGRNYSETNPLVGQLNLRPGLFVYEFTGIDDDYGTEPASIYDFPDDLPDRWISEQMVVIDVDGDGQQELLFPNNGRNNRYDNWYILSVTGDIGSGFEVWNEEVRISSRASEDFDPVNRGGGSPYAILPADLDGDGTYELSMHSWNNFNFTNGDVVGPDTYQFPDANAQNVYIHASDRDHVALFGGVVVDINGDGDDEVFYPNFYTGQIAILNYESGENPLEVTPDQLIFPLLEGPTNLGITAGDLDGDGNLELIGAGYAYSGRAFTAGEPSYFIRIAEFTGGDPEDPSAYTLVDVNTALPIDSTTFNVIFRDSAGVSSRYYEPSGGNDPYFPAKLAYLGDPDQDGKREVAVSFQGVDDSLDTYDEVWTETIGDASWVQAMAGKDVAFSSDNNLLLLLIADQNTPGLLALNPGDGMVVDTLDLTGVSGGDDPLYALAAQGAALFGVNLVNDASATPLRLYRWTGALTGAPELVLDTTLASGGRFGDALGILVSGADSIAFIGGATQILRVGNDGQRFLIDLPAQGAASGGIAPVNATQLWINGVGEPVRLIDDAGQVLATVDASIVPLDAASVAYHRFTPSFASFTAELIVAGPDNAGTFYLVDVTDAQNPRLIGTTNAPSASLVAGTGGGVTFDTRQMQVVGVVSNASVEAYPFTYGYVRTLRARQAAPARAFMRIIASDGLTVDIDRELVVLPSDYQLSAAYPNPFRERMQFSVTLPLAKRISVRIYDMLGREVRTLVEDAYFGPGTYTFSWDGTDASGARVASGMYFYTLEFGRFRKVGQVMLVR